MRTWPNCEASACVQRWDKDGIVKGKSGICVMGARIAIPSNIVAKVLP